MKTREIRKQINMAKIHRAITARANKNLRENKNLFSRYGGVYTQAEINLAHDLYPGLWDLADNNDKPEVMTDKEIVETMDELDMYMRYIQEDNTFMV